jgi:hypothetical protein
MSAAPTRVTWIGAGAIFAGGIVAGAAFAQIFAIGVAFFLRLNCH